MPVLSPMSPRPGETDEPKQPGQEREQDDDRARHGLEQALWLSAERSRKEPRGRHIPRMPVGPETTLRAGSSQRRGFGVRIALARGCSRGRSSRCARTPNDHARSSVASAPALVATIQGRLDRDPSRDLPGIAALPAHLRRVGSAGCSRVPTTSLVSLGPCDPVWVHGSGDPIRVPTTMGRRSRSRRGEGGAPAL
jgi:hypothetical protein